MRHRHGTQCRQSFDRPTRDSHLTFQHSFVHSCGQKQQQTRSRTKNATQEWETMEKESKSGEDSGSRWWLHHRSRPPPRLIINSGRRTTTTKHKTERKPRKKKNPKAAAVARVVVRKCPLLFRYDLIHRVFRSFEPLFPEEFFDLCELQSGVLRAQDRQPVILVFEESGLHPLFGMFIGFGVGLRRRAGQCL